jgi:hypothetical protein
VKEVRADLPTAVVCIVMNPAQRGGAVTEFALPVAIMQPAAHASLHAGPLLTGLGLAIGMEFYTFDSLNLVLPGLTAYALRVP